MRILRIIARLNIGGPAIQAVLLSGPDVEPKYRSKLICGNIGSSEGDMRYLAEQKGVAPIIIAELGREISPWKDLSSFLALRRLIGEERPQIVHTHTAKAGTLGRLAILSLNLARSKYRKIKAVHTFHGHVFEGYFSKTKSLLFLWIERLLAMATDVIIAISDTQKKDLAEKFHIAPAEKIRTIELGFDLMPFLKSHQIRGRFRKKCKITEDTLLIAIVGRLVPIKNHRMFFRVAKLFLEQNPGLKVKFVVVGDGELRDELKAYSRQLGLADLVIFCGWVREIHLVYADLDILTLTSLNEGTPVSIIEAMASSVPVIATDAGGVPDLVGHHAGISSPDGLTVCERGMLCRKDDASGFAKGLRHLVDIDERQKQRLLTRARSFVKEHFSEERLIRDMESLYFDLMTIRK
jgi:glycosyltransferase involved in cell wall biosynthesis